MPGGQDKRNQRTSTFGARRVVDPANASVPAVCSAMARVELVEESANGPAPIKHSCIRS
jgi:hypothetical protein